MVLSKESSPALSNNYTKKEGKLRGRMTIVNKMLGIKKFAGSNINYQEFLKIISFDMELRKLHILRKSCIHVILRRMNVYDDSHARPLTNTLIWYVKGRHRMF